MTDPYQDFLHWQKNPQTLNEKLLRLLGPERFLEMRDGRVFDDETERQIVEVREAHRSWKTEAVPETLDEKLLRLLGPERFQQMQEGDCLDEETQQEIAEVRESHLQLDASP